MTNGEAVGRSLAEEEEEEVNHAPIPPLKIRGGKGAL